MKLFTKLFLTFAMLCFAGVVSAAEADVKVAPDGWTNLITNGNLAGDDVSSYFSKEAPSSDIVGSAIVEGAGKDGSRGIVVKSADETEKEGAQAWDTQFWIKVSQALPEGTKLHVEFDYKASQAAKASTQAHAAPGAYQHWAMIGDVNFTTEWQHFSADVTIDAAMAKGDNGNGNGIGLLSIAFNLAEEKSATEYYFDNFGVWAQIPEPVANWKDIIVNGNMEGDANECFYVTEQGVGGPFLGNLIAGIGKDGSKAFKVQSADGATQDWDSQFFIRLPYQLPAGTKYKVSFDYKADKEGGFDTQAHAEPGQYIHWAFCGSGNFTTDWQTFTAEGTVPSQCDGSENKNEAGEVLFLKTFQTIAFNLAKNKAATEFIFDNVKFEIDETVANSLTPNPAVNPQPYPTAAEETVVTFDFNASNHATSANDGSNAGDITEAEENTIDGVVMTISPATSGTPNRYWSTNNGPQLRMYSGTMTIVAPEGKAITKVVINQGKWNNENKFNGVVFAESTWTGNSTNFVFDVAGNTQMNSIAVTIADANAETTTYGAVVIEKPATPTFTPAAGEYTAAQNVTIACETEGAAIYYTLDGTDPTAESTLYAEAIAIAETTTVKAIAIKDGEASDVAEATYTINLVEPVIAEGKYYIFNPAANGYIVGANNWGTRASISQTGGIEFEAVLADGKYELKSAPLYAGKHLGFNGYVDNADLSNWTIAPVEGQEGVFTLATTDGKVLFWDGGNATTTTVGAMPESAANAYWKFISPEERLATFATATAQDPVDATFLISNPNFSREASSAAWNMVASNKNLCGGTNENKCAESYHSTFTLSQTLANAPKGVYALTAQGFFSPADAEGNKPVFYANEETVTFPAKTGNENSMDNASVSFLNGLYVCDPVFVKVTEDGALTIGAKLEENTSLWCIWDNFQLSYYGENTDIEEAKNAAIIKELAELREKATELKDQVEVVAVKNAIDEALAATAEVTGAEAIKAAIETLKAVIEKANVHIAAKPALDGMKNVMAGTNVYTAEAFETYNGIYVAAKAKYDAGELTAEDKIENPEALMGWHAANIVDDLLLSAWTIGETQCKDYDAGMYINTWSVEGESDGSNFKVPFFEYWVADANSLAENTLTATMSNVPEGDYNITAWVRVRAKNGYTAPAYGIALSANEGEAVDVAAGDQIGESQFYMKEFTAVGTVAEDGVLKIQFKVAADNNISWLSFKNVKFEKKPVVNDDDPEIKAPEGWINLIANGNLAGDNVANFVAKEAPSADIVGATIVPGAGKNNSRGLVVKSADEVGKEGAQDWDTQFWIKVNEPLVSGSKLHVEFDYAASKAAKAGTQAHGEPGAYQHWAMIGDVNFTTEWQHFSQDIEIDDAMAKGDNGNGNGIGLISVAFNLAVERTAVEYYFDNFGLWYQKPVVPESWTDLIVNGNMEGESMECFYVTEQGVGGPFVAVATDGIGKDGGKAVKVQSADNASTDWDSQFFIRLPYQLPAGTKYKVSFDYKADKAGDFDTQAHAEPGQYIHWAFCGSGSFTTEWQTYEKEGTVPSQCDGSENKNADTGEVLFLKTFQTIAFNLAKNKVATMFVFDNVKFEIPADVAKTLTPNPAVNPQPYPVGIQTVKSVKNVEGMYNLNGQKVNKAQKGLYILNGKKMVVK